MKRIGILTLSILFTLTYSVTVYYAIKSGTVQINEITTLWGALVSLIFLLSVLYSLITSKKYVQYKEGRSTISKVFSFLMFTSITLGLAGTFVGLIEGLNTISISENVEDYNISLANVISSFVTAFGTTILGIISSIHIGFLKTSQDVFLVKNLDEENKIKKDDLVANTVKRVLENALPSIVKQMSEDIQKTISTFEKSTSDLLTEFKKQRKEKKWYDSLISETLDKLEKHETSLLNNLQDWRDILDKSEVNLKEKNRLFNNEIDNLNISLDSFKEAIKIFAENSQKTNDQVNVLIQSNESTASSMNQLNLTIEKNIPELKNNLENLAEKKSDLAIVMNKAIQEYDRGQLSIEETVKTLNNSSNELVHISKKINIAVKQMKDAMNTIEKNGIEIKYKEESIWRRLFSSLKPF